MAKVKDPQPFCENMKTWATELSKVDKGFANAWYVVRAAIFKSSFLRRLMYEGEKIRTKQCPIHKGHWSGIFVEKPEGCLCMRENGDEACGWIPEGPEPVKVKDLIDFGQVAYEAYCGKTNWKSLVTGQQLPDWKDLKEEIREAWNESARAVLDEAFNE